MNTVMVTTTLGKVENIKNILAGEFDIVAMWQEKGILAHLLLKEAGSGAVLIFNEPDLEKVKELISTLPLFKHFEKVEYTLLNKQF